MFKAKWKKHLAMAMAFAMMCTPVTANAATENAASGAPTFKLVSDASDATAMSLAQALVGEGVKVVSAKMEGAVDSFGSFSNAGNIVGFSEGLVVSTGRLDNGAGNIFSKGYTEHFSTDVDGQSFTGAEKEGFDADKDFYDYTMLEFTYIPTAEDVSFQYSVASEEYPEFISNFFDQFVLLVNGQNYALVPETGQLVTIGTVNHLNNSQYYRGLDTAYNVEDAISATNFVYDGITTTFSVSAKVNPGQENTIRVAIADKGDGIYDSAVFIKAGSVKEKEATPGQITAGAIDGDTLTLDREEGTDGFVAVDVTFQDINKNEIGKTNVSFNDGESQKDLKVPANTAFFFLTASAGGVTVAPEVETPQEVEKFEVKTMFSVAGKVFAESASIFDTTVSGGDSVSDGDTVSDSDVATIDVTGKSESAGDANPVSVAGAEVSIKGKTTAKTTITDENGNFSFKNLKQGVYQVTATKDGKSSSTIVKVNGADVTCEVTLQKYNSIVDTGSTGVMVDGLADLDVDANVTFKAGAANAADIALLEQFAGQSFSEVYDFTINKTDDAGQNIGSIHETGDKLISVVMPLADSMKGMQDYKVYRVHNGVAEVITETPNADGEYIEVLQEEGVVILHVNKFSAYTSVVGKAGDTPGGGAPTGPSAPSAAVSPKTGEVDYTVAFWMAMVTLLVAAVAFGKKALLRKN